MSNNYLVYHEGERNAKKKNRKPYPISPYPISPRSISPKTYPYSSHSISPETISTYTTKDTSCSNSYTSGDRKVSNPPFFVDFLGWGDVISPMGEESTKKAI